MGTADAGKAAARVATVQIALDDLFDDRTEETVLLLEAAFILRKEVLEIMEQHPIENRALRMNLPLHQIPEI